MTPSRLGAAARYRTIVAHAGSIFIVASGLMLTPLALLLVDSREAHLAPDFLLPSSLLAAIGVTCRFGIGPVAGVKLRVREASVVVLLGWVAVMLASTWPFLSILRSGFTAAMFEAVSGWTTTGLSVVDVTTAPRLVLLWRSLMQLGGGAGLAILTLATITGPTGPGLSVAEGRSDQLAPHVRDSVRIVVGLYGTYAAAGVLTYWLAGMSPFDAVNHSFAAVSTGGFSTRVESIGAWDSAVVEAVSLPLMLLGSLNFLTAHALFRGRVRTLVRSAEFRLVLVVLAFMIPFVATQVAVPLYGSLGRATRVAVFESVTALTTTGFSTVGYTDWPAPGWIALIVAMLIGGGSGSTAGGLKQYRVYLLLRSVVWEIRRWSLPRRAVVEPTVWAGERRRPLRPAELRGVSAFASLYLAAWLAGAAVLAAHGAGLPEALFEFASTVGTVGLSVGVTGADTPAAVLWTQIAGMILGRLEFFVVIVGLVSLYRDARRMVEPLIPSLERPRWWWRRTLHRWRKARQ